MDSKILIKVKTMDNVITEFSMDTNTTIADFKVVISEKLQIPPERQRLIYQGRQLADDKTISEQRIQDSFVLHLVGQQVQAIQTQSQSIPEIAYDLEILTSILRTLSRVLVILGQTSFNRQNIRRVFHQQRSNGFTLDRHLSLETIRQNHDSVQQLLDTQVLTQEIQQQDIVDRAGILLVYKVINPFKLQNRNFKVGQWIDLKDTIDQWLEAQVLQIQGNRIFVHYNGWGRRWDEWVNKDSPRIAVFRTYTVGSNNQEFMSPTPMNEPDADVQSSPVVMNDFIFDVGHTLNRLTSMVIELGKLENQKTIQQKQLELRGQNQSLEFRETQTKASLVASQLAPLFDRVGRMMIDIAPHLALMGTQTQTGQFSNQSQMYQFQVPITLTPSELASSQLQNPTLHSRLEIVSNRLAVLRMTELMSPMDSDEEHL